MMEDETSSLDGKGLINMRVVDLKLELEKRGLSKSGSKKDLVKRLKQQLEFEKLCEERKSGDSHPKLELDAEIQQNEFVQQYLAQQQKRYAERQEEKRLELEAMKKSPEEGSAINIEHQSEDDENMSSDSDDKDEEIQNLTKIPYEKESLSDNTDNTNVASLKSVEADDKGLHTSECESKAELFEENILPPHPLTSVNAADIKNNRENIELAKADENQNIIQNLNNVTEIKDEKLSSSICLSETETNNSIVSEKSKETDNLVYTVDNTKEQKHFEAKNSNQSIDKEDSNTAVKTDFEELTTPDKCLDNSSLTSKKVVSTISYCVSTEKELSDHSTNQISSRNMEVSDCAPVPYSLSDIQLPESPSSPVKSKDTKCEEKNQTDHVSDDATNEKSVLDNKSKSNGETVDKLNSSQEDISESETKDSSYSNDSPEKIKTAQRQSESSDSESNRSNSSYKNKSYKYEKTSSNLATDSDNDHSKDTPSKEQKYAKAQQNTDESDNEKSSDSEKYNRHVDSKHKSHNKRRKRDSRSSSSSSSRSSESSPERRRSKKPVVSKSKKIVEDEENKQMSDKSSDERLVKHKKSDSITESSTTTSDSVKKRLKIKRDNVPIEIPSPAKESSETNISDKNIKKKSSSHCTSDQPIKQESHDEKEPEISYKPRKVILSSRKLNRKSSEENSIESSTKKSKWGSFSSAQKSPHTVNISSDSLRNWFPDFKLISETSMEVEQEEHSLSAIDEKNDDPAEADTLNVNESNVKLESTSQMDMEDSASQDANSDDVAEMGPVSKCIFIQNLVRPFTLNQLKELLKQSGKIVEEYFWIDKIKSKCFVMYESEKEAIKARHALNNTRWPTSNPKILSVEFSSVEELENHQKGNEPQPIKPPEPPAVETLDSLETKVSHTVEEHKRKDRERRKEKDKAKFQAPIREWDKDKILQDSPEREHPPKEEKSKSAERKEKKESKKRATEDTPAKLLDDLFQKTKSVPCIYWLPLTEERAKVKEEERKMRRIEREKRNQQLKEQEEAERRNRRARSTSRRREKENRKSSTRSRSPVSRRR